MQAPAPDQHQARAPNHKLSPRRAPNPQLSPGRAPVPEFSPWRASEPVIFHNYFFAGAVVSEGTPPWVPWSALEASWVSVRYQHLGCPPPRWILQRGTRLSVEGEVMSVFLTCFTPVNSELCFWFSLLWYLSCSCLVWLLYDSLHLKSLLSLITTHLFQYSLITFHVIISPVFSSVPLRWSWFVLVVSWVLQFSCLWISN